MFKLPGTRQDFWREKIDRNRYNDQKVRESLIEAGWRVGVVWECSIRGAGKDIDSVTHRLGEWLRGDCVFWEERG